MNDVELERLVANLPWATPGPGLDARVQATLRAATVRSRIAAGVMAGSLIAASLAVAWLALGRSPTVVGGTAQPLAGPGGEGRPAAGGDAEVSNGPGSRPEAVLPHVAPRGFSGGVVIGGGGRGSLAMLAALLSIELAGDPTAVLEHVSALLPAVPGIGDQSVVEIRDFASALWRLAGTGRSSPARHGLDTLSPQGSRGSQTHRDL